MDSIYFNSIWELIELPKGVKLIGYKWVFKRKRRAYGNVNTYKTKLVAKDYTQKEEVNYEETFSLVSMFKSIRIFLSVATCLDPMDVKTTFLNGYLEGTIYMKQSEGFIVEGQL